MDLWYKYSDLNLIRKFKVTKIIAVRNDQMLDNVYSNGRANFSKVLKFYAYFIWQFIPF
jgi:hypothetical protein